MKTKTEWRAFVVAAVLACLALLVFIIAVSTDYWLLIDMPLDEETVNSTEHSIILSRRVGLWEVCTTRVYTANHKTETTCNNINLFPTEDDEENSNILLDYRRSETAMSIVALSVMILGEVFMVYAYKQNKYMITRLTGILFLISVVAVLACIQLFQAAKRPVLQSVQDEIKRPVQSHYGWSFGFAWVTLTLVLVAGVVFLALSRKRKKTHGVPGDEEDTDSNDDNGTSQVDDL
ncbi:transmembrane protein 114-like [Ptychodera flava]|uniref:transmembrane protein 114-like n=1 Tax=Ptychodera flava TaxID=63121 RepID=UPI00396A9F08